MIVQRKTARTLLLYKCTLQPRSNRRPSHARALASDEAGMRPYPRVYGQEAASRSTAIFLALHLQQTPGGANRSGPWVAQPALTRLI